MRILLIVAVLVTLPAPAFAQAIAGLVRDSSHRPLAGVLVEASSPALIEKVRTAVTNSVGRYRIEDLRPGTYSVRFVRIGWTTYQQNGVELTGLFTATVNADLTVGALAASVTVTAEVPVIDLHTARRQVTMTGEVIRALPTVRSYNAVLVLVPGVLTSSNDTVTGTATTLFPIYGGRANEGRLVLGGLTIGSPPVGNSATNYVVDVGQAEEVTFVTAGGLGEAETAGLVMNIVPKSGGNALRGTFFASGTDSILQSDNLTPVLRNQGVTGATPLRNVYDVSGTLGGPIRRDRLWYFVNAHVGGSRKDSPNVYYNLNAGRADQWLYAPDLSRLSYSDRTFENASGRVTWQIAPRHRIAGFWDAQAICRTCTGATPGGQEPARISPEAVGVLGRPLHATQVTFLSTLTSRLILDAGFGGTFFGVANFEREPNPTRDLVRVAEQCAAGCMANGNIPGLVYRSQDFSEASTGSYLWKAALSYITGSHSVSVGYQHTYMTDDRTWMTNDQNLTYRVNNGVPNQLTQSISPWVNNTRVAWQAVYLQEQWTRNRLTLQGAVRFDHAWSWFPEQREGPSRFLPGAIVFPETRGVDSYTDVTVRMGAAYDLGGARTVLKGQLGEYLEGAGVIGNYANTNPSLRMPQTTSVFGTSGITRAWIDENRNFVPDCDLLNPLAQDLRTSGGDRCGVMSNTNFGQPILTNNFDPAVLSGWGVRPSDWHLSLTLQRQIGRRSMVDVTYTRRWAGGFFAADNLALQPDDLTPYTLIAPRDPRLPGGGGYEISGLYDVVPEKAGQVDNLVTDAKRYGGWRQRFDGLDVTVQVRAVRSLTVIGGLSVGQSVADNCEVRARLPELSTAATGTSPFGPGLAGSTVTPVSPYCRVAYGVLPQARGLVTYLVPKVDLLISATMQSKPGGMLAANYAATNADVAPSLRRELSGSAANVTVNLIEPGTMYGDRLNQLDVRFGKTFSLGGTRTLVALDVYNALNSSAVLSYNQTFVPGGPWLQPLTIVTPRFFRFTAEVSF